MGQAAVLVSPEDDLRLAIDAAEMGTWEWDIPTGRVALSSVLERLHKLPPGAFGGTYESYLALIHPNDRESFALSIASAIQEHTVWDLEYRVTVPGGTRWLAGKGRVRYDAAGNATRMLGVGMEITARKRAEEAVKFLALSSSLLSSTLDYETVLERTAELVVPTLADWCGVDVVGPDGSIKRLKVTHADPDKKEIAQKFMEYVPDARMAAGVVQVLRSGHSILQPDLPDETLVLAAVNKEHLRLMRELGFRSIMIVPLLTREKTLGALTLVSGESGHRYDDGDLALAEDLAKRAALAIDNAALYRDAQRIAEELTVANAAKDEFLSLVSHELRTPLTTIYGNAQVLQRRRSIISEDDQQQALRDIETDADRLNRIVENLLALARLESGRDIHTEPIVLHRLVAQTAEQHRLLLGRTITESVPEDLPPVAGQATYVEQVLSNLLSNAAKYSPREAPIDVEVRQRDDGMVAVTVLDRGSGIADDEIERIFAPFYRSRRVSSEVTGAGIGLAVCRRLVEAQGGEIGVRQRPGGGAIFSFTLPLWRER